MTRFLVTRPEPDATRTAARLSEMGYEPVLAPMLTFEAMKFQYPPASDYAGLVLTSGRAVEALVDAGQVDHFAHLPLFAVGARTADSARDAGFQTITNANGDAQDLVKLIAEQKPTGRLLYPAARHTAANLPQLLAQRGILLDHLAIYDMHAATALPEPVAGELTSGHIDAVLSYSPRTSALFVALAQPLLNDEARASLTAICISRAAAQPFIDAGYTHIIEADRPDDESMMNAALAFARGQITS